MDGRFTLSTMGTTQYRLTYVPTAACNGPDDCLLLVGWRREWSAASTHTHRLTRAAIGDTAADSVGAVSATKCCLSIGSHGACASRCSRRGLVRPE